MKGFAAMGWSGKAGLTLIALLVALPVSAREYGTEINIVTCDDLYRMSDAGELTGEQAGLLIALCFRPMDLNRADRTMLYDLPGMTYALADSVLELRRQMGSFESVQDLLKVPGMSLGVFTQVELFVGVDNLDEVRSTPDPDFQSKIRVAAVGRDGSGRNAGDVDPIRDANFEPEGFVEVRGRGLSHFAFGGVVSHRTRTAVAWDYERGHLTSSGPVRKPTLDNIFLAGQYQSWSLVLGNYDVGFGQRLVFDTTSRGQPRGWYENRAVGFDLDRGRVDADDGLLGFAVSLEGADAFSGWFDVTGFMSYRPHDLYQYGLWVNLDPWHGNLDCDEAGNCGDDTGPAINSCNTDTDCPFGYTCKENKQCYSNVVYDSENPDEKHAYVHLQSAYDEFIVGANASFNFDEKSHVGITAYRGQTAFNIASELEPTFAYSHKLPQRPVYGAVGIDARWGWDIADVAAEMAFTDQGAFAAYLRGVMRPIDWVESSLSLRHYTPLYDNPYSRGQASLTTTHGRRSRNEQGVRWVTTMRPTKQWRFVTDIDLYRTPKLPAFDESGELNWLDYNVADLRLRQTASFAVTKYERLSLEFKYNDNDLANREEAEPVYELTTDTTDAFGNTLRVKGAGNKLQGKFTVSTKRLRNTKFAAQYILEGADDRILEEATVEGEDDSYRYFKDVEHAVKLWATVRPWRGAKFTSSFKIWLHDDEPSNTADVSTGDGGVFQTVDGLAPSSDREEYFIDTKLAYSQKITDTWSFTTLYRFMHYRDNRINYLPSYHVGKLELRAAF